MQYTVSELRGLFDTLDLIEELSQKYEYFDKYQLDQRDNIFQVEFMDQHLKSLRNTNICDTNQCQYNLWDNWLVHKTV